MDSRPLIVTARLNRPLFEKLDELRRHYFPEERNFLKAHLTMFHHLPGEQITEVSAVLSAIQADPIDCRLGALKFTGRGMQIEVACDGLNSIRNELTDRWKPWLTPQDAQPYRPHVTIQNKVDPAIARQSFEELRAVWQPMTGSIVGLDLWHYAGGPWEPAAHFDLKSATPGLPL